MQYKVTVTGFDTISVEAANERYAIQRLYSTPLNITDSNATQYNTIVEIGNTKKYFIIENNDFSDFVTVLHKNRIKIGVTLGENDYVYGNHFSLMHTNLPLSHIEVDRTSIPDHAVEAIKRVTDLTKIELDIPKFVAYYNSMKDNEELVLNLREDLPVYDAFFINKGLEFLAANSIFLPNDYTKTSPCYIFLNDDITSQYYYMLLPMESSLKEIGLLGIKKLTTMERANFLKM